LWGLGPIFAADLISFSNLGHASWSNSILPNSACEIPDFRLLIGGFLGAFAMADDVYLMRQDLTKKKPVWYVHLELSTRELKALGDLVSQWSLLESMIEEYSELMASFVSGPPPQEIYSDSFRKRVRAMATLVRMALPNHSELPDVLSVISRISSLQGQAHKLRHGLIRWSHKNRNKLEIRSRKNAHEGPWIMDAKGIEMWARKISELNASFLQLHGMEIVPAKPRRGFGKPVRINPDLVRPFGGYTGQEVVGPTTPRVRKPRKRSSGA